MNKEEQAQFSKACEKEYLMLRDEIMYFEKQRDVYSQVAYTISAALFTISFSSGNCWLFMVLLLFLLPISLKTAECADAMAFLATYMKEFLEPNLNFNWETMHYKYYSKFPRKGWNKILYFCGRWDFVLITVMASFLFWLVREFDFAVHQSHLWTAFVLFVQAVAVVIEFFICEQSADVSKIRNEKIKNWRKLNDK